MVDKIRERFGIDAVKRAVFTVENNPVDHMSGGISREKRTVDYSKIDLDGTGKTDYDGGSADSGHWKKSR